MITLTAPNGTLHKFIAKEIAMNTADDDPSMIRQKILRHAYKVSILFRSYNGEYAKFFSELFLLLKLAERR